MPPPTTGVLPFLRRRSPSLKANRSPRLLLPAQPPRPGRRQPRRSRIDPNRLLADLLRQSPPKNQGNQPGRKFSRRLLQLSLQHRSAALLHQCVSPPNPQRRHQLPTSPLRRHQLPPSPLPPSRPRVLRTGSRLNRRRRSRKASLLLHLQAKSRHNIQLPNPKLRLLRPKKSHRPISPTSAESTCPGKVF